MASELNASASLSVLKNSATANAQGSGAFDVAGTYYIKSTVSIGTGDETLDIGDVATVGMVFLKNLDATNYIQFGQNGTDYAIKLLPGEFALFRWTSNAIHAKAHTGACLLEFLIVEA